MSYSLKHIKYLVRAAKENNFSFPLEFMEKTPQWLRRHYNGIGAEWMPKCVRSIATKAMRHMEPHALLHDVEYLSAKKSYWRFTIANLRLMYNGFKSRHILSGIVMFLACQLFGWTAWKEGKETMAYCYYLEGK